VSDLLDDSTRERAMYHKLVADIRKALGPDALDVPLLDLPAYVGEARASASPVARQRTCCGAPQWAHGDDGECPGGHKNDDDASLGSSATGDAEVRRHAEPWRPIASCPKDGTWLLAWDYDGGYYVYRDGPGLIAGEEPAPTHWIPLPPAPGADVQAAPSPDREQGERADTDTVPPYQDAAVMYALAVLRGKLEAERTPAGDRLIGGYIEWLKGCKGIWRFLQDGETPVECIVRNRADVDTALGLLAKEKQTLEALVREWRAQQTRALADAAEYDRCGDTAGNSHAYRKEARIWGTCADALDRALKGGHVDGMHVQERG
jgi:hypothetical protein